MPLGTVPLSASSTGSGVSPTILPIDSATEPEFRGIVAFAAIGSHDSGVIGRDHLPHLFVAVAPTDLIYRAFRADKYHQMSGASTDAPSGVVGIDHGSFSHAAAQLLVACAHLRFPAPQGVLRHGTLGEADSGEVLQHHRQFPHWLARTIMQHVCRRFDSRPHPVCRGPKLVRRQARRGSSHALATLATATNWHAVTGNFRLRLNRKIGRGRPLFGYYLQLSAAMRAAFFGHCRFHDLAVD